MPTVRAFPSAFVGSTGSGAGGLLRVRVLQVRVWSIDRTQVEIQSTMHTKLSGIEIGLVGYWSFDECAGGIIRCVQ